jgi:hypothetical protein
VEELGECMSAQEFGLWLAWFDQEPCDPASFAQMWAQQMAALCNGPLTRRDKRMFSSEDFLPADRWKDEPDAAPTPMTRQQTAAALKAMFKRPKG